MHIQAHNPKNDTTLSGEPLQHIYKDNQFLSENNYLFDIIELADFYKNNPLRFGMNPYTKRKFSQSDLIKLLSIPAIHEVYKDYYEKTLNEADLNLSKFFTDSVRSLYRQSDSNTGKKVIKDEKNRGLAFVNFSLAHQEMKLRHPETLKQFEKMICSNNQNKKSNVKDFESLLKLGSAVCLGKSCDIFKDFLFFVRAREDIKIAYLKQRASELMSQQESPADVLHRRKKIKTR